MYENALLLLNTIWYERAENRMLLESREFYDWYMEKLTGRRFEDIENLDVELLNSELLTFRNALVDMLAAIEEERFDEARAIELLNNFLHRSYGNREIVMTEAKTTQMKFSSTACDENLLLAEVAKLWYELLFERDRARIKMCENPECLCYFFDESKNKTKRHCVASCSNLMKVRRHRSKKKAES